MMRNTKRKIWNNDVVFFVSEHEKKQREICLMKSKTSKNFKERTDKMMK